MQPCRRHEARLPILTPSCLRPRRSGGRRAGGFSVVELLVVLGIIIVLVGMGTAVISSFHNKGLITTTKQKMATLSAALSECRVGQGTIPGRDTSGAGSSANFVSYVSKYPKAKEQLSTLFGGQNPANASSQAVYDAWGTAIEYFDCNLNDGKKNADGTLIYVSWVPERKDPFFASAGPDCEFGTTPGQGKAIDNIFSYDVR
jgi:prepilin peptidase dependent protein D